MCPPVLSKPVAKSKAPLGSSPCVSQLAVPVDNTEELGLDKSGGAMDKIIKHAMQQIDKSVVRATAKLETLIK